MNTSFAPLRAIVYYLIHKVIMKNDLKILTIQDASCYGQCSITVALPILSACGYETAILPTSILSTHTTGFKNFRVKDLDNEIKDFTDHWKEQGLKFDVIYTGYLGSESLIDLTIDAIKSFKKDNALVVVDPAMGDKGKLYPLFNTAYALKMRELIKIADIIIPNITEASYLCELPYQDNYDQEYIEKLLKELSKYTSAKIILTDVGFKKEATGVYIYDQKSSSYYTHEKLGDGLHGTGDVFSSSFVAAYLKSGNLFESAKMAADYVYRCIGNTIDDKEHWYGVKFEPLLSDYANRINEMKRK